MNFNPYGNFGQGGMQNPFMKRQSFGERIKNFFKNGGILSSLMLINIVIFLLINIYNLYLKLMNYALVENAGFSKNTLTYWLSIPAQKESLLERPWTVITYMFTHQAFFHIFFNMFLLYVFGRLFLRFLSKYQLLKTYLFGGIAGAAFFVAAYNFFPAFTGVKEYALALGASASVMAVVVTICAYIPNYEVRLLFIGSIKMKWIAIAYVLIDLISIDGSNPGGHIAHLGGASFAVFYVLYMKIREHFYNKMKTPFSGISFGKKKSKFKTQRGGRPISDEEYNRRKAIKQAKIDAILEKISKEGYSNLSEKEKKLLFNSED